MEANHCVMFQRRYTSLYGCRYMFSAASFFFNYKFVDKIQSQIIYNFKYKR